MADNKVTVSFETTEANNIPDNYEDISLSGPIDIFATADRLGDNDSSPTYDEYTKFLGDEKRDNNFESLTYFLANYSGKVSVYSWAFDKFILQSIDKENPKHIIIYVDNVRELYENKDHRGAYFRLAGTLEASEAEKLNKDVRYCVWQEVLLGTHSHDNISTLDKLFDKDGVLMIRQDDGSTKAVGCGSSESSVVDNLKELLPESFKNAKNEWDKPDSDGYIVAPDGTKIYEPLGSKPYHLDARLSELINTYDWKGTLDNNASGSCRDLYLELINVQHRVYIDRSDEDSPWKISLDSGKYEIAISATNVSFNGENEALQAIYSPELKAYIIKFPFNAINVDNDEFFIFSDGKIIKEINNGKVAYKILKEENKDKLGLLTLELKQEAINQLRNKEYSEITVLCVHGAKKEALFRPLFEQQFDIGGDLDLETIRTQLLEFYAKNKIIAKPKFPQLFLSTDESGNIQWTNTFTPAQRFYSAQKVLTESDKENYPGYIAFPAVYFDPTEDFPLVMNDQAYEYTAKVVSNPDNSVNVYIDKDSFPVEGNSIITLIIIKSGAGKSLAEELADKYISKADAIKILSKGTLNINEFLTKKAADSLYAAKEHYHSEYALRMHNHDERYANFYHTHPEIIKEVLRYIKNGISDEDIDKINKEIIGQYSEFYEYVKVKFSTLNDADIRVDNSAIISSINRLVDGHNAKIKAYNESIKDDKTKPLLLELTHISDKPTLTAVLLKLSMLIDRSAVTADEVILQKPIRVNLINGPVGGISENQKLYAAGTSIDDILRDILDPYYDADEVKDRIQPVSFNVQWYIKDNIGGFKPISLDGYQKIEGNEMHVLYFKPIVKNKFGNPCEFKYIGRDGREWPLYPDSNKESFRYYINDRRIQSEVGDDGKTSIGIYKYSDEAINMVNSELLPITLRYYNVELVDSHGLSSGKMLISEDDEAAVNENGTLYKKLSYKQTIVIDEPDFYYGWAAEDAHIEKPDRLTGHIHTDDETSHYHIFGGYFNDGIAEIKPCPNEMEPVIYVALEDKDRVKYSIIDSSVNDNILPFFELADPKDLTGFDNYTVRKYHVYFDDDDKEYSNPEFGLVVKEG